MNACQGILKCTTLFAAGLVGGVWLFCAPTPAESAVDVTAAVGVTVAVPATVTGDDFLTLVIPTRVPDALPPAPPEESVTESEQSGVESEFSFGPSQVEGLGAAVAVAGVANQTFSITLPGQTSFSTGSDVIAIDGFSHNAGTTPTVGESGTGVFNVTVDAALVPDAGGELNIESASGDEASALGSEAESGAVDPDGDTGTGTEESVAEVEATPIITQSPYVDIIISYN